MISMTPVQSKLAAIVLLLCAVAVVVSAIAVPWWLLKRHYDVALEDAITRLQRYSKIAGMHGGLQKKAEDLKSLNTTSHFLKSSSPALAATELQELVKTILEARGGKINSIQILPHKDEGEYRMVPVALQMAAPQSALRGMLHALESLQPYLFIDNLSIRSPAGNQVRAVEPDVIIQFDLTGYALKSPPQAQPTTIAPKGTP